MSLDLIDAPKNCRHIAAAARLLPAVILAMSACLLNSGCQPSMTNPSTSPLEQADYTVADWPLRFDHHQFGVTCFDTQGCKVDYNDFEFGNPEPSRSRSALTPDEYDYAMTAMYGPVARTAAPAKVSWRSKDGTQLHATVDIAALFADGLVRHKVPQDQIPEGVSIGPTHILLQVDDRTIGVYARTMVPTKTPQVPGNDKSTFRDDLFKIDEKQY